MFNNKRINIPIGARAAVVYSIANVFSRGLAIVTMPIFTRIMTADQIGDVSLFNSWFSMISCVATLSLTAGGFSVAMKEYEHSRKQYISSVLTLTSLIAIVISIVYFINIDFWNDVTGLSTPLMILIMIGLLVAPATDFWLAYERYEYRYKESAGLIMGSAFLASLFSIVSVIIANNVGRVNISEIRLYSNYIVVFGIALFLWIRLLLKGRTFVNIEYWKFSLKLSLPLVGYSIASQILGVSDRIMISRMVNKEAVGIYSTIYSVSSLFTIVWTAINASFVPYLYQNIDKEARKIKRISFFLLFSYSIVAVLMVLLAPEIVKILATEKYYEAIYIMPPIAAGVFMTSVANMYSNILLYVKSSIYIMLASAIAAISNLLLNYLMIPKFGYMIAAYTTMFSYIIMLVVLIVFASLVFKKVEVRSLSEVYANGKIIILSLVIISLLMLTMLLYKNTVLRYMAIIVFCTAFVLCVVIFLKKYLKKGEN